MGRPRIYTSEEAKKRKKDSDKISGQKRDIKVNSDPVLKREAIEKQMEANDRYEPKKTQQQKDHDREYNTNYQRERRARLKLFSAKVSCEQAEEL